MKRERIDSAVTVWIRDKCHALIKRTVSKATGYSVAFLNECKLLPEHSVIYSVNHQQYTDCPIAASVVPKRSYILLGKQRLRLIDKLFFFLNGTIIVDRKSKEDRAKAKSRMLRYLRRGCSIIVFPEGTWNLTKNRILLPMRYGIITVAREANAQIVPVILNYDRARMKCYVRFGEPIAHELNNMSDIEAICYLRDSMASLRWEYIESQGVLRHSEFDMDAYVRNTISNILQEYPPYDLEYETSIIYKN